MVVILFLSVLLVLNRFAAAANGDVGEACITASNACTGDTLVCEGGTCKLKGGKSCDANADKCVSDSSCKGTPKLCTCNDGYSLQSATGLCSPNGGSSQFASLWLLCGSVVMMLTILTA